MKPILNFLGCIALVSMLILPAMAQTQNQTTPKKLTDQKMSTRLKADLTKRNSQLKDEDIGWWDSGYGFYGRYNYDNNEYMTQYDRQGNYLNTMRRSDQNNLSASLKASLEKSPYRDQEVIGYWEVTDPAQQGYYLELKDDQGKINQVWADKNGVLKTKKGMEPETIKADTVMHK